MACAAGLGGNVAAAAQDALAPAAGPTPTAGSQSFDVAVAPFVNLSQRRDDDGIGERITEALATALRARGWTPASCTRPAAGGGLRGPGAAAEAANESRRPERAVCPAPDARARVEGAHERIGDRVHITAEIVDVATGEIAHRTRLDGPASDLLALVDRLASTLADGLAAMNTRAPPPVTGSLAFEPAPSAGADDRAPAGAGDAAPASPTREPRALGAFQGTGQGLEQSQFTRDGRRRAVAVWTARPPRIDGRLDDAVWASITPITGFVQTSPVEGAPATERTEVRIAYDRDHLYVAFHAHYADPGIVRATRAERDQARADDRMAVLFDPFRDQQRAYVFSVNGYGVKNDAIVNAGAEASRGRSSVGRSSGGSGGGSGGSGGRSGGSGRGGGSRGGRFTAGFGIRGDLSWDALFDAGGRLVEDGWTAEMAIPFKSLRYPSRSANQMHRWGFQISRNIREKSESLVWSPVSTDVAGQLTQMGVLDGLLDLSRNRNLELLPTFTGVQAGSFDPASGGFRNGGALGELGLGVKYGISSNLTLDVTLNPDFSQIESDQPQVETNQRFALFYPELRPFFLEGQEIFAGATPVNLVHTRTIVDPRFGAKLSGKVGDTTLGVVVTDDEATAGLDAGSSPGSGGVARSFIGRARYDLYPESYVGVIATAREHGADYTRVGGVDGRLRLNRTHSVSFTVAESAHRNAVDGELGGSIREFDFAREARNLTYSLAHSSIEPDVRTGTGFIPRVDVRRTDANVGYRWWPGSRIISWGPSFTYLRNYSHQGVLEDEQFHGAVNFEFIRSVRVSGGINRDLERYGGIDFRKTSYSFAGAVSSRHVTVVGDFNGGDGIYFSDDPFLGRSAGGRLAVFVRPGTRLRADLQILFSRLVDPLGATVFDVKIFRSRAYYQFSNRLMLRHIMEHNTLRGALGNNVLLTYRINAGTAAFLGYDDRFLRGSQLDAMRFPTRQFERTNRAVFTKVSYLFRF